MIEQFSRTEILLGEEAMKRLYKARVAVFGVGGVGGYTVEALARCGVGQLDLCDSDTISVSNINRQILATHSTVGRLKVEVAKERILDINPNCVASLGIEMDTSWKAHANYYSLGSGLLWWASVQGSALSLRRPKLEPQPVDQEAASHALQPEKIERKKKKTNKTQDK